MSSDFTKGIIHDVEVTPLAKHLDERGWLAELYRSDEMEQEIFPAMAYISVTNPGIARGPHEHVSQTDCFCFLGPSNFKVYLWDHREGSPTRGRMQTVYAGEDAPRKIVVPPGVVHAYRNIGTVPGMVINAPDSLYAGKGRMQPVDEIRHEDIENSPFRLD